MASKDQRMDSTPKAKQGRSRSRRTGEEVVERLRGAATSEFASNGYSRTKTAMIAQSAGVSETLLFKHFGSKARLFNETVFGPIDQHFEELSRQDGQAAETTPRGTLAKRYILEMQDFFRAHADALRLLIMSQSFEDEQVHGIDKLSSLHRYFAKASDMARAHIAGEPRIDPKLVACISFATVLSCELFRDWLFPEGWGSEDDIHRAVADFVFLAVEANGNPANGNPA